MSEKDIQPLFRLLYILPHSNADTMKLIVQKCIIGASQKNGLTIAKIVTILFGSKQFLELLFGNLESLSLDVAKSIAIQNCATLNLLLTIHQPLHHDFNENRNEYYKYLVKTHTKIDKIGQTVREEATTKVCGKLQSIDDKPALEIVNRYTKSDSQKIHKNVYTFAWYDQGKLNREKGPSFLEYTTEGTKKLPLREEWRVNGKLHRKDGPALSEYSSSGRLMRKGWYVNQKLHRKDGPAFVEYLPTESSQREERYVEWRVNGKLHRKDGPALVEYDLNKKLLREGWYTNGQFNRKDGPAYISFHYSEGIMEEEWYKNGKLHRKDKPAKITYILEDDLTIFSKVWYLHGKFQKVKFLDIK